MKWPLETLRLFPTFRCTRGCSYCVVRAHGGLPKYAELKPQAYTDFFASVEGVKLCLISGGEPSLYPGLVSVVKAALARGWMVGIYTNCAPQMVEVACALEPSDKLFIDCSYHAEWEDVTEYAARWLDIWTRGYKLSAATIMYSKNLRTCYDALLSFYDLTGHRMVLKPLDGFVGDEWFSDHAHPECVRGEPRTANCYRRDLMVAPDGAVYRCHRFMYTKDERGVVGTVGIDKAPELTEIECAEVNNCNTCDAGRRRLDGKWERRQ